MNVVKAPVKRRVVYRVTDIGDVHSTQVEHERTVLGQSTNADSEEEGDEVREADELPEAVWALIGARSHDGEKSE